MIYRLPTRGTTRYRGAYPHNIRSVSGGQGVVHLETQNGFRYVASHREFIDLPRCGQDPSEYTRNRSFRCLHITAFMYQALLDARPTKVEQSGQRALLAKWDTVFAAVIS